MTRRKTVVAAQHGDSLKQGEYPCPHCGYNVVSQVSRISGICPECGGELPTVQGVVSPSQWRQLTGQGPYDRKKLTEVLGSLPVLMAAIIFLTWLLLLIVRFYRHLSDVG